MKTIMIILTIVYISFSTTTITGIIKGNLGDKFYVNSCKVYCYYTILKDTIKDSALLVDEDKTYMRYTFKNLPGSGFNGYVKIKAYGYAFKIPLQDTWKDTLKIYTGDNLIDKDNMFFTAFDTMKPTIYVKIDTNIYDTQRAAYYSFSVIDNSNFIKKIDLYLNKDGSDVFLEDITYGDSSAIGKIKFRSCAKLEDVGKNFRFKIKSFDAYGNIGIGYSDFFEVRDSNTGLIKNNPIKNKVNDYKICNSFDLKGRIINKSLNIYGLYIIKSSSKIYKVIYTKK